MKQSQNFYINSQESLEKVIRLIREAKLVAIDTEFTRQTTYYPILSIIQIAVKNSAKEKESFIIDCLSHIDLSDFFTVIADKKIIKILHSCAQDLQIFHHKSGLIPQNIIDTQVMANFCGFGFSVGYSGIVEMLFDQQLDKKQQRSDWQIRPLSQKQIEYALLDVIFLEEIYDKFNEILKSNKRQSWFLEEMQTFIGKTLFKSDESLSKNFSFKNRSAKQISQIRNLILLRERWAKKINVPRQHLIKDEALENMVINQKIDFNFTKEMSAEITQIFAGKVLEEENADSKICQEEEDSKRRGFFMSAKQKDAFLEAKKLISKISTQENLREQFLITSSDLKKLVCEPKFFAKIIHGWRYEVFGKDLEQLIS